MKIIAKINAANALKGFSKFKKIVNVAIENGVNKGANQLLTDSRPYVPMLTGRLRDSGIVAKLQEQLYNYAYSLVWSAANPSNNYIYAEKQYGELLQHVDGKYAARWIEKTLQDNEGRYTYIVFQEMEFQLRRVFESN